MSVQSAGLPGNTVILLDLNYTLVANSELKRRQAGSYAEKIGAETYRAWLVEMMRGYTVALCTVRHVRYEVQTLERLLLQTGWRPDMALFNPDPNEHRGEVVKRAYLQDQLFPRFGFPDAQPYLAIESATATRAMYESFGILAVRQEACRAGLPSLARRGI